jgi:uncharacterized membrane protein
MISFVLILMLVVHSLHLRSRIEELSDRLRLLEHPKLPPPLPRVEAAPMPPPLPPPLPVSEPVFVPEPKGPSLADQMRSAAGGEEWEALIGGSILNKLGALVLVIGIALFLGFSFGRISPAGRAAMASTVSLAMLGGGVWAERQARYRFFARGLIGAGWAALYATAYAVYAIPAAQVIADPFAGSLLPLAVGAGMIAHSLRYRSEALTGIAYFSAFAALAVTPSSPFAVLSLIPLAASLLWLARKFEWRWMAVFGMAATWVTCMSRGSADAPLAEVQALFLAYWLMFELFDLAAGANEFLYFGNMAGFLGLSYAAWAHHAPDRLWMAAAGGAGLYLADAVARAALRARFEVSVLVSALLAGASLVANVAGVWLAFWLAVEAEAIYLIGVRIASPFLQYLGLAAFAHSLLRLGLTPAGKTWTPPLVFHAALFYVNRVVRRPNALMSWAAAALVALAIGLEVSLAHLGAAWIVLAIALFEAGERLDANEFRVQAYTLAVWGAVVSMVWGDVPGLAVSLALMLGCAVTSRRAAEASGIAVPLTFLLVRRAAPADSLAAAQFAAGAMAGVAAVRSARGKVRDGFVTVAVGLFLWGVYVVTPGHTLTVAWGVEGVALLAGGFGLHQRVLRLQGLAVLAVCILKLFLYDLRNLETLPRILSFVALGAIMLGVSWIYTRFRDHLNRLL